MYPLWLSIQQNWLAFEIIKVTIIIEVALALTVGISYLLSHSRHVTAHISRRKDVIFKAIKLPLQVLIWFSSLKVMLMVAEDWPQFAVAKLQYWLNESLGLAMLLSVSWVIFRIMKETRINYLDHHNIRPKDERYAYVNSIHKFGEIILIITTILIGMELFKIPISGVLTIGGVGGAAFSIANREMIANFFSGFMTHLDRPFEVGDFIYSSDKSFSGRVERIGLRFTVIRNRAKRPVFVPNANFNTVNFINRSRMTHRRILQYISLQATDLEKVRPMLKDIYDYLYHHEAIDSEEEIRVNLIKGDSNISSDLKGCFNNRTVYFQIMAYSFEKKTCPFLTIQDEIMLEVANIIKHHGLDFSYINQKLQIDHSPQ